MGVWDAITEIFEAAAPWGEAQAEAPAEEPQTQVGLIFWPAGELGRWGTGSIGLPAGQLTRSPRRWTRNRDVLYLGEI